MNPVIMLKMEKVGGSWSRCARLWRCPLGNQLCCWASSLWDAKLSPNRDPSIMIHLMKTVIMIKMGKKRLHSGSDLRAIAIAFVSISKTMRARRSIFLIYHE